MRGDDHVEPQSVESANWTRLLFPTISIQTATRCPPPAFATTGNACVVSAELGGETSLLVNNNPPSVEPANPTPPTEVA